MHQGATIGAILVDGSYHKVRFHVYKGVDVRCKIWITLVMLITDHLHHDSAMKQLNAIIVISTGDERMPCSDN